MKKKSLTGDAYVNALFKWLRIMRFTLFILLVSLLHVSASVYSQQTLLSVNAKNASVKEVLRSIEDQSDFYFLYKNDEIDVNRKIDFNLSDKSLDEMLSLLFKDTNVKYEVHNRQIVLRAEGMAQQQNIKLSGKVTDTSGAPLPGVTIVVKGTTNGIITNFDGVYSLSNVPADGIIQFSFVGMKTLEIPVAGKTSIDVVLEEDAIGIEEVVAIGYGTMKRSDLTGSVASVSGSTLKDIPITSASQAIVGRLAGVQVTKTEGSPDAEIKIRVRGGGSITQDNSPLYVVDGFPVDNLNDIAPTDIESIDVLKDASSTAIYGARGANGVIIVTTKGGFEGKTKISYNMYTGIKNVTKKLDVLDPYEYVFWQYEIMGTLTSQSRFGNFQDFDLYKEMEGHDWQEDIFGRTGTSLYNNLSISGGNKSGKYNLSLTQNDEKAIMLGSGYKRTNLTVKTSYNVTPWLKVDLTSRFSDSRLRGAGTGSYGSGETFSRLPHVIQYRPVNGISEFVDQELVDGTDFEIANNFVINPVQQTNDDYRRVNTLAINFNGAFEIKFTKNFKYRFSYGKQYSEKTSNHFYGLGTANALKFGIQPLLDVRKSSNESYRIANIFTYHQADLFADDNFTVMVGEELNCNKYSYILNSAKYFPKYISAESALSMMSLGIPDPIVSYFAPDTKISSFFGRLNYDLKNRYLFSATFRADGSSKFAKGNQWGYFPSAAFAWRISKEDFMASSEAWLSNLKLRLSYGESGNNRIASDAWKKTFSVESGKIFLEGNETTPTNDIKPESILSNPSLKWETTTTRNIGFDFGFLNQRIQGTVDLYKNSTRDLLIKATIPSNTGYSSQYQNIGETSNKGIELVLDAVLVNKSDFRLSASLNVGINRGRIEKLGEVEQWEETSGWASADGPTGDYLVKVGEPVGLMYGYETLGMYYFDDFDYDEEAGTYTLKEGVSDNSTLINAKFFGPGALKLKDQNDDGIVNADDKVVVGNANPKHTGGFNLTAQWKGFDLSAFFNWVYGNDVYNANKLNFTNYQSGRTYKNMLGFMNSDNRFINISKETGLVITDPTELAAMNANATYWSASMTKSQLHSWAVEDGSFLRFNNMTIGYSLPKSIIQRWGIEQCRIYATGYNLWILTNYSGYDPEVDSRRSTPLTPGVDWCAYPRSRSYNVGINLTF